MYRRTLFAGGALLLTAACAESPTDPTAELAGNLLAVQSLVDICHYDADLDAYFPISVSDNGNAVDAHLAHGDGFPDEAVPGQEGFIFDEACAVVEEEPEETETIFAIAYTDVDPVDGEGFKPGLDVLIAKLVDDGDGVPGAGDRVVTGRYPVDLSAGAFADFGVDEHVISGVFMLSNGIRGIMPEGTGANYFDWERGPQFESYDETFLAPVNVVKRTAVQDVYAFGGIDGLFTDTDSPSEPTTLVSESSRDSGTVEDPFIDVDLFLPPAT